MIKYTKRNIETMIEALEGEYEHVGQAAEAALKAAESVFEQRAAYVVVGQLYASKTRPVIHPGDPEAIKVCLGYFSTEGDARKAAESVWTQTQSGDHFRCWILPVFNGTPAEFHGKRKAHYAELEQKRKAEQTERLRQSIEKYRAEAEERARQYREEEAA